MNNAPVLKYDHRFFGVNQNQSSHIIWSKIKGADVPIFETFKTNAGTQPKNELQQ